MTRSSSDHCPRLRWIRHMLQLSAQQQRSRAQDGQELALRLSYHGYLLLVQSWIGWTDSWKGARARVIPSESCIRN